MMMGIYTIFLLKIQKMKSLDKVMIDEIKFEPHKFYLIKLIIILWRTWMRKDINYKGINKLHQWTYH